MCFSARVRQNLKHLSRRYEAEVDWAAFEELYRRRAEGEDIRASRDLQRNFQHPETDVERRTAAYIAHISKPSATSGRRASSHKVAASQRRKNRSPNGDQEARENIRIGTKKAQEYLDRLADLRSTEPNSEDARIFPLSYAPVLIAEEGRTSSSRCAIPVASPESLPTWRSGSQDLQRTPR